MAKETITIVDKTYLIEDLSDKAKELVNNINFISNEISRKTAEAEVFNISKDVLIKELITATSDLTEVVQGEVEAE